MLGLRIEPGDLVSASATIGRAVKRPKQGRWRRPVVEQNGPCGPLVTLAAPSSAARVAADSLPRGLLFDDAPTAKRLPTIEDRTIEEA